MRIGLILPGFSANETDWAIPVQHNLARALAAEHDVRIVALRYPHTRRLYTVHGAVVHPLGVGHWTRGVGRLRLWWDALRLLHRLHREAPFDVLHAMWADECGLLAVWAGRRLGVPVVVSVAGGELARLDGLGYGLQRSRFSRWVVGQALRAERVSVYSTYARRLIAAAGYRVPEARLRMIPLGIDPAVFHSDETPRAARRLLHVGSLIPVKDQTTLLRALAYLPQDVTLDIIGEGPLRSSLAALADELGVVERVRFLGAVEHLTLAAHYRRAALHVFSSRHEALLMTVLEAAACGLPSVGTAVGLLPDRPDLGITVPVGDAVALAQAVESLLHDPARRATLGRAAHRTVMECYTIERTAAALAALYAEVIRDYSPR